MNGQDGFGNHQDAPMVLIALFSTYRTVSSAMCKSDPLDMELPRCMRLMLGCGASAYQRRATPPVLASIYNRT